jgi:formylglycine-generating enzyme required for sulfatase activity
VTNKEVEEFEQKHQRPGNPGAVAVQLGEWRDRYGKLKGLIPKEAPLHPATGVPWQTADRFARSHQAMLPTEAQWEWAARSANPSAILVWSDQDDKEYKVSQLAYIEVVDHPPEISTVEVSTYRNKDQTQQGVIDMAGNVREWCRDVWEKYSSEPQRDPTFPPDLTKLDSEMVVRGSSALGEREHRYVTCRGSALRLSVSGNDLPSDVGFRLVIECPELALAP